MDNSTLLEGAKQVLSDNDREGYTVPANGLYPHQWLWDSCFIAIGIRHYDVDRAQTEILSLLRGQWSNGMLPNMILSQSRSTKHSPEMWRSQISLFAPDNVATSGITQPPMLAEAIVQVGKKMTLPERRSWYQQVFPALLAYHTWLYAERDPHGEGLTLQIHPWETGMDNTPPWMYELHQHLMPFWVRVVEKLKIDHLFTVFRRDRRYALPGERLNTVDGLALYSIQRRLRRKAYNIEKILTHNLFTIEDVAFNSIFIRANHHLKHIAKTIGKELPKELLKSINKTEDTFELLWDAYSGQYYSRNFVTHKLIKIPSISTLLPLYAGSISDERAKQLVGLLKAHRYSPKFPVPTVPTDSEWFNPHVYWQGPTWINMNWMIIDGLKRYGYDEEAEALTKKTLELVKKNEYNEYFSPLDGSPAGVKNFSWTAALTIDLLTS